MANYPLYRKNKNESHRWAQNTFYSDEYAEEMCSLFLRDEYYRDEHKELKHFYRLHASSPHNIEQALAYDIHCPKCGRLMKQTGRCLDSHTLGLYECRYCNN